MSTQVEAGYRKPRIQFTADGEQKEFHFYFTIYEPENVRVYIEDELQTSGYSLSQIDDTAGGSITFQTAPQAGRLITIYRDLELKRTTDFKEGGPFRSSKVNTEFDYQLACLEQLEDSIGRTVTFPQYAPMNMNINLPMPDAGKSIIWNEQENSLINSQYQFDDVINQSRFYCNQSGENLADIEVFAHQVSTHTTNVAEMKKVTESLKITTEACASAAAASAAQAAANAVNSLYNQCETTEDYNIILKDGVTVYRVPEISEAVTLSFDFSQLTNPANLVTFEVYLPFDTYASVSFSGAEFNWLNDKVPNLEANDTMTKILTFRNIIPGDYSQWIVSMEGGY